VGSAGAPAEFGPSRLNGTSVIKEIRLIIWPLASRLSRSLSHRNRHRSIRHISVPVQCNHRPISYRFRDKRRFQSKIANFSHLVNFATHAEGFSLKLGTGARGQKTRMVGLAGRERSFTMSSAVWIQYTNVTDRQTDGQTPGDSDRTDRAYV